MHRPDYARAKSEVKEVIAPPPTTTTLAAATTTLAAATTGPSLADRSAIEVTAARTFTKSSKPSTSAPDSAPPEVGPAELLNAPDSDEYGEAFGTIEFGDEMIGDGIIREGDDSGFFEGASLTP